MLENWNVMLRHEDPNFSFNKTYSEYALGFGTMTGDYYIGNEVRKFF